MAITHCGQLPKGNNGISIQSLEGAFLRLGRDSDGLLSAADLHGAGAGGVVVVSRVVYHGKKGWVQKVNMEKLVFPAGKMVISERFHGISGANIAVLDEFIILFAAKADLSWENAGRSQQ